MQRVTEYMSRPSKKLKNIKDKLLGAIDVACRRLFRKVRDYATVRFATAPNDDKRKILETKGDFFFNELADRAEQSQNGVASTYLSFPYLPFLKTHFYVSTRKDFFNQAASYGEFDVFDPSKFDPGARKPFGVVTDFIGVETMIAENGRHIPLERRALKTYLDPKNAIQATRTEFSDAIKNWSSQTSINDMVRIACINILAKTWLNLVAPPPKAFYSLIKKAEHLIFNYDSVDPAEFCHLKKQIKDLNDAYVEKHEKDILSSPGYLKYLLSRGKVRHLKDLNGLAGLVVEGNITTVLTGAILEIARNKALQTNLHDELLSLGCKSPLLHHIWLEALRFYAPAAPVVRYASKAAKIAGVNISKGSFIFLPTRRIMHDPREWQNPHLFDPMRHINGNIRINTYPLVPFSTGKRVCPASFGYAETIFKEALICLFRENSISLFTKTEVETIPVNAKQARFKKDYFGTCQRRHIRPSPSLDNQRQPSSNTSPSPLIYSFKQHTEHKEKESKIVNDMPPSLHTSKLGVRVKIIPG